MDARTPALRDPDLDEQLRRHGFATFPLIDRATASRLRAACVDLDDGGGEGAAPDPSSGAGDASVAIGAALDAALGSRFLGCEPFFHRVEAAAPGDAGGALVQDGMYVDERSGARAYVAWVALEDVVGHNAQLRVLRGSHQLDRHVRGAGLTAPWLRHTEVIEPRLVSVPVPAGHAIVFDSALVHTTFPNHTDRPRIAAAIGLRPAAVELTAFVRLDEQTVQRFDVDEAFFETAAPADLLTVPPGLPAVETLFVESTDLDPRALAATLDAGAAGAADRVHRLIGTGRDGVAHAIDRARTKLAERRSAAATTNDPGPGPEPEPEPEPKVPWATRLAQAVLSTNEAIIDRFGPDQPAIWSTDEFAWTAPLEAAYPEIRTEVEALLVGRTEIPHIQDVTGGIPQGNVGPWRSLVFMHQGTWIPWNCERCPRTTAAVKDIPGLTVAGFSVLEPGTHITTHRGPNKGALRYQLGVIVPGELGDCRIRVGDEMIRWREGEGVIFDFTVPHEAWNDTDRTRVLLMLEFITPLPWYLAGPNRLAQRAMSWFPTTRDLRQRLLALEPSLQRPEPEAA